MPTGFYSIPSTTNGLMATDNVDFSGSSAPSPSVTTNGQLLIGSTITPNIKVGNLTSPNGTIQIGYSSPNITLDLTGGATAIERINVQTGTSPIGPTSGQITFNGSVVAAGTNPVRTDGTGSSTMALEVQISQAISSTDATKIGLCNFNSSQFSVDANGFVSTKGNTVSWQTITANQTLVKNNGYMCISAGGALSLALPSTASSTIGDIIEVTLDGATSWTITQAASQQVRLGSTQTTSGVGGSLTSTAQGDTIKIVYQAGGKWNVVSSVGNITIV